VIPGGIEIADAGLAEEIGEARQRRNQRKRPGQSAGTFTARPGAAADLSSTPLQSAVVCTGFADFRNHGTAAATRPRPTVAVVISTRGSAVPSASRP
jgi:hypothetical protein